MGCIAGLLDRIEQFFTGGTQERSEDEDPLPSPARSLYGDTVDDTTERSETQDEHAQSKTPLDRAKQDQDAADTSDAPDELPDMQLDVSSDDREDDTESDDTGGHEEHTIVQDELDERERSTRERRAESSGGYTERTTTDFDEMVSGIYEEGELSAVEEHGDVAEFGFFSEFQTFLERNDIHMVGDELVQKDLLSEMKRYHEDGRDEDIYFHTEEIKEDLRERLQELRSLEHDWFEHKEALAREESRLLETEEQIEDALGDVRELVAELREKSQASATVDEEEYFHVTDGSVVKSLRDLRTALSVMDDDIFKYHVEDGNDFARWVEEVFDDATLAEELRKCETRDEMIQVLQKHLK